MGRGIRIDHPGAVHLVTNRGTAQTMIYRTPGDRRMFMSLLADLERNFGVRVLAFVLMGNHYHMLVSSDDGRLSDAMRFLDGSYARMFNQRHDRSGALFQARFHSALVQSDEHFQTAGHYVHLNPVRAGLVARPEHYAWSSARHHATGRSSIAWLDLDLLRGRTGAVYAEQMLAAQDEVPESHRGMLDTLDGLLSFGASDRLVAAAFGVSIDRIYEVGRGKQNLARVVAIVHAAEMTSATTAEVALRYGLRNANGVHNARHRLRSVVPDDAAVAALVRRLGITLRLAS